MQRIALLGMSQENSYKPKTEHRRSNQRRKAQYLQRNHRKTDFPQVWKPEVDACLLCHLAEMEFCPGNSLQNWRLNKTLQRQVRTEKMYYHQTYAKLNIKRMAMGSVCSVPAKSGLAGWAVRKVCLLFYFLLHLLNFAQWTGIICSKINK